MKKIILTVEVLIDEKQIVGKYPNFSINHELKSDLTPSKRGLLSFAKRSVSTEKSLRDFGFSTTITKAVIEK